MNRSSFVTLKTFRSLTQAEVVKSLLESMDIYAELWNTDSQFSVALEINLVIRQDDVERAQEVLNSYMDDEFMSK